MEFKQVRGRDIWIRVKQDAFCWMNFRIDEFFIKVRVEFYIGIEYNSNFGKDIGFI